VTYAIRETFGPLAGGTRVELVDPENQGFDAIAKHRHGYVTVRMVMSKKLRDQKHPLVRQMEATNGAFDIEADNLVKLRVRAST